jgi:peptidoglycan-N-acetylglucosamine deacetylase
VFDRLAAHAPGLWQRLNLARLAVEVPLLRAGAVYRGPTNSGAVALTFDDGPDPRWTPRILEALAQAGARATFFCLASAIEAHPALAREVAAHHEVGTHLYDHDTAAMRSPQAFAAEVARVLPVHAQVLGQRPTLLRFPYGHAGRIGPAELATHDLRAFHWTFSSEDASAANGATVAERVRLRLAPGSIVLLHDGRGPGSKLGPGHREATVAAVPAILAALADRGLAAVTLSELMARHHR